MLSLIFISLPDSMTSIIGRKMMMVTLVMMIITVMSIFRDIMSCYGLFTVEKHLLKYFYKEDRKNIKQS